MTQRPIIAITSGDVAGIGPEIVMRTVRDARVLNSCRPAVVGHPELLTRAARLDPTVGELHCVTLPADVDDRDRMEATLASLPPAAVPIINPCSDDVLSAPPSEVSAVAGHAAFQCLTVAAQLALSGAVDGIATAPLNKEALSLAGHCYPGHTEILASLCGVDDYAMMLHLPESKLQSFRQLLNSEAAEPDPHGCGLSIAHVTLHTSIASVPTQLTERSIVATTMLMRSFLRRLGSPRQSIGVAALNPHAGEHGLFGDEEATLISPAVQTAAEQGCRVVGPLPADSLIRQAMAGEFDGVIAMYHDQGHIPVKLIGVDSAINITLGLPIVRTSPTHGTAFDRAWNLHASVKPDGMIEALMMAAALSRLR